MYRNYVPPVLYGFLNEIILPLQILDYATLLLAAKKTGRGEKHLTIICKGIIEQIRC